MNCVTGLDAPRSSVVIFSRRPVIVMRPKARCCIAELHDENVSDQIEGSGVRERGLCVVLQYFQKCSPQQ